MSNSQTTVMGRLIITIMAAVAEMERDLTRERTAAGLAAARAQGRFGGRTSKWTDEQIMEFANLGTTKAMARTGMSKTGWLKRLRLAESRFKSEALVLTHEETQALTEEAETQAPEAGKEDE